MGREQVLAELAERPLEISVRQMADDLTYGEDTSRYVGAGVDYAQSRPFVQGDPVKSIDWRVTARTGKYHVKEYEALKRVPIYLVVDTSASMNVSSHAATKQQLAAILAGGIGLAALRRQSPVGIIAAGSRALRTPVSLLRIRLQQWLEDLQRPGHGELTRLSQSLEQAGSLLKSKSLLVVISDFHDPDGVSALKRLACRHDCVALHLQDPAERGHLRAGFFRGREAETGRGFVGHGRTRFFGRHNTGGNEGTVGGALRRAGIDYLMLRTDQPFMRDLRHFLQDRGVLRRNTR